MKVHTHIHTYIHACVCVLQITDTVTDFYGLLNNNQQRRRSTSVKLSLDKWQLTSIHLTMVCKSKNLRRTESL